MTKRTTDDEENGKRRPKRTADEEENGKRRRLNPRKRRRLNPKREKKRKRTTDEEEEINGKRRRLSPPSYEESVSRYPPSYGNHIYDAIAETMAKRKRTTDEEEEEINGKRRRLNPKRKRTTNGKRRRRSPPSYEESVSRYPPSYGNHNYDAIAPEGLFPDNGETSHYSFETMAEMGSRRPSIGDIAPANGDMMQLDEFGFAAVPPHPNQPWEDEEMEALEARLARLREPQRQRQMAYDQAFNAPVLNEAAAVSSSVDVNPVEKRKPSLDPSVRNGNPDSGDQGTSLANIENAMDGMYESMFGGQRPNPDDKNMQNMIMNGRRAHGTSLLVKPLVASGIVNPVERLVRSRQPLSDNGSRTIQPIYGTIRMY
jgi:hypothetical protein